MTRTRLLVLTVGPLVIVASTALAARLVGRERGEWTDRHGTPHISVDPVGPGLTDDPALAAACCARALRLQDVLGRDAEVLVEAPFVLAGDLPRPVLAAYWDDAVAPVARALWNTYFDRRPDACVTVILCRDCVGYRQCVRNLFGDDPRGYCGYYRRGEHTLVVDVSAGSGAIAHELTHALLEFDFPTCPQWLDEGLASLHEHGYVSEGRLVSLPDGQLRFAAACARDGSLEPLEHLFAGPFRGGAEATRYAQARALCLYLDEEGVLASFYRAMRDLGAEASGAEPPVSILARLGVASDVDDLDRRLHVWLVQGGGRFSMATPAARDL